MDRYGEGGAVRLLPHACSIPGGRQSRSLRLRRRDVRVRFYFSEAGLDGYLPDGRRRDEHRLGVLDGSASLYFERSAPDNCPQEDVSVQQKAHQGPSNEASTLAGIGSSKSRAICTLPFSTPNRIGRLPLSSRVMRTSGFPFRLTTTSSPETTLSTNCDRRVFAS